MKMEVSVYRTTGMYCVAWMVNVDSLSDSDSVSVNHDATGM